MNTPVRRYPAELSHNPSGPSRPPRLPSRPVSQPHLSVDDEVPLLPVLNEKHPPKQPSHEYASLEHLLRQAGYKETRVFTPEAERVHPCHTRHLSNNTGSDLADLYASIGVQHDGQSFVSHTTEPGLPVRSSSSILRSVALQDASAALNERRRGAAAGDSFDSWWGNGLLSRAAQTVGKSVAAMSPPSGDKHMDGAALGLGLAKGGQGVRKAKSYQELSTSRLGHAPPQKEDVRPPILCMATTKSTVPELPIDSSASPLISGAFANTVPPSIADMFCSPQRQNSLPLFDDDTFGYCPLPDDYEAQEEEDLYALGDDDSFESGFGGTGRDSADDETLATIEEVLAAERDATQLGQRILASTIQYTGDLDSPPRTRVPLPVLLDDVTSEQLQLQKINCTTLADAMTEDLSIIRQRRSNDRLLRSARSVPTLPRSKSTWFSSIRSVLTGESVEKSLPDGNKSDISYPGRIRVTPTALAAPAIVTVSPVVCDSLSANAVDLPPINLPAPAPARVLSSVALRARSSLAALRDTVWAAERSSSQEDTYLTLSPRLDWSAQGNLFAGWKESSQQPSVHGDDPFSDSASIDAFDYTKSFFYKPTTPPRAQNTPPDDDCSPATARSTFHTIRKRESIKHLRAALLIPVRAPPVPPIPVEFRSSKSKNSTMLSPSVSHLDPSTPPRSTRDVPVLSILSPGAWEAGRPPRELVLEGEEWDATDRYASWRPATPTGRSNRSTKKKKGKNGVGKEDRTRKWEGKRT